MILNAISDALRINRYIVGCKCPERPKDDLANNLELIDT